MASFMEHSATDVVEINVGGEVMMAHRGTFTLAEGAILEAIFSGRWEQPLKRDEAGRVFLDFSPAPFKALLSFLRALRDAQPGKSVAPPVVPPKYKEEYEAMVTRLGLEKFLGWNSCPVEVVCPADALVCAQSTGGTRDGSIQYDGGVLCAEARGEWRCAVGSARLLGEDGRREKATWKVTVARALLNPTGFLIGVIGNASPTDDSHSDPTCWAWSAGTGVILAGASTPGDGGWDGWMQGDVAVFQLDASSGLRMFLRRSRQIFHIMQGVPADTVKRAQLYFGFCWAAGELEVSQVTAEDLAEAGL